MVDFLRIVSFGFRVFDFEVYICFWFEGELGFFVYCEIDVGRVGFWSRDVSCCGGFILFLDGEGWFFLIDDVVLEVLIVSVWFWDVVFFFVFEFDGDFVCCFSCCG